MIDPHAYNITIRRGIFEGEECFEARVKELPDLMEYADSYEEAYQLAIDAIETTAEVFAGKGRAMPQPHVSAEDYSGRITLRLPKSLHRAMVLASEEEGVSLNYYVVNVLSYYSGFAAVRRQVFDHDVWRSFGTSSKAQPQRKPHLKIVSSDLLNQPAEGWKETG